MTDPLWKYLRHDKRTVTGWLQRVDAEIIGAILAFQRDHHVIGSCVEVGVHHGKSFIPLCMALNGDELALCIDVFDDQYRNRDHSGRGDLVLLQDNFKRFGLDTSRIRVFRGSSEGLTSKHILSQVGPVRFFSVDGGHWKSIVQNDLRLAEGALGQAGVIALDDYCRVDWPDVTTGYALWQEETESRIVPFAVGSNKLYLCHAEHAAAYRRALDTPFLRHFFRKSHISDSTEVHSYRTETIEQDEAHWRGVLDVVLRVFRPDWFIAAKGKFGRRR